MAKTVRLLGLHKGFKPGSILTLPDAEADALLFGGVGATLDLTGGTVAYQEAPYVGTASAKPVPLDRTVSAGQRDTFVVPANVTVALNGSSDIVGSRETLAADGTVAVSTPLVVGGALAIGPFFVDTTVRLSVTAGSVTAKVVATAQSASSAGGSDLGPSITVPAGSNDFVLRGAGNGGIGDKITAIKFTVTGAATTVTLTDGDGTAYPDPSGTPGLIPNPYNAKQILGLNAVAPADLLMYGQPSYSGAWKVTTGANVSLQVFGTFS